MFEQQDVHLHRNEKIRTEPYPISRNEILIIDDETDFRLDLAELLFTQGFRVITAKNGKEAIDYINHSKRLPELVTLDVKMPEKDGIEFLKELRKINKKIPVIFISGFVRSQQIDSHTRCLEKPLDKLQFFEVLEEMRKNQNK